MLTLFFFSVSFNGVANPVSKVFYSDQECRAYADKRYRHPDCEKTFYYAGDRFEVLRQPLSNHSKYIVQTGYGEDCFYTYEKALECFEGLNCGKLYVIQYGEFDVDTEKHLLKVK